MTNRLDKKIIHNEDGFSLVELVIVIVILAIIASIAIPKIIDQVGSSRKTADVASGAIIGEAAARILTEDSTFSEYESTGINISDLSLVTGDGIAPYDDDFMSELYMALGNDTPVPTYKGTSLLDNEEDFILTIDVDNSIAVYIGDSNGANGDLLMIYPDYDEQYDIPSNTN